MGRAREPGTPPAITLLTDFGLEDAYVAAMKGVIAGIAPAVRVVDISHQVPPQDIRRAGIVWAQAVPYFPPGTIHVAVVDPGVGSARRILACEGRGALFLAPDNGLIGQVLARREVRRVFSVTRRSLFLPEVSSTFHGRDIFAPVAARLSLGLELDEVGPRLRSYRREELPRPILRRTRRDGRAVIEARGEVITIDRFGNAMTNLRPVPGRRLTRLEVRGQVLDRLSPSYSAGRPGRALALVGSAGYIEVAVNRGSAAERLGLRVGETVRAVLG